MYRYGYVLFVEYMYVAIEFCGCSLNCHVEKPIMIVTSYNDQLKSILYLKFHVASE